MNQIRYILSACLILLMISAALFLYKTFPESGIIAQNQPISDFDAPAPITTGPKGEQLFKQNCASCHAIDKDLTGPALGGVLNRGPWAEDRKHVYSWVHDPGGFMKDNPYTQGLKLKYGVVMTAFPQLKNEEIDMILTYAEYRLAAPKVIAN